MHWLVPALLHPRPPRGHCRRIRDVELDAHLRHGPLRRPLRFAEARLGGLGQRPDTEVLAAADLVSVVVPVILAAGERQPQRVDVQLAAVGRVGRDNGQAREELDLHAASVVVDGREGGYVARYRPSLRCDELEAMLIYSMSVSVDGFIADRQGAFGWSAPSDELFRFHLAQVRGLGSCLLGRRLYETMLVWETDPSLRDNEDTDAFADVWSALPKVV